ncbi:hypothetical protein K504DRAFT_306539 [Pleomassaria siparia CBS 279.74]|uniref:Uncharacterized protein n=1 Tax=Pleomassaria siparia CBS 279.74 TaxID=1314801 RepID=A0A6G1K7B5_9PLEO|nr:hypothetical protein K504DRAFT_306539 [Pleomassaria siparia CBS 279.74]
MSTTAPFHQHQHLLGNPICRFPARTTIPLSCLSLNDNSSKYHLDRLFSRLSSRLSSRLRVFSSPIARTSINIIVISDPSFFIVLIQIHYLFIHWTVPFFSAPSIYCSNCTHTILMFTSFMRSNQTWESSESPVSGSGASGPSRKRRIAPTVGSWESNRRIRRTFPAGGDVLGHRISSQSGRKFPAADVLGPKISS